MKLIADSGSTKTDWVLTENKMIVGWYKTQGMNPFHQSEDEILAILHGELLPAVTELPDEIQFYGSGVRKEMEPMMERLLKATFPTATNVKAHSDLLEAARAVCGHAEGIACILGTGANSCLYDGEQIVSNTPPLGYVLGDEGSGAVLGIRFLNALYKGFLPASVQTDFERETGLLMADVIARVYRQPLANRFLASLSPFVKRHLAMPEVRLLVVENFRAFFRRNIAQYQRQDLPVGFVGSMAYHYTNELTEAAKKEGFTIGKITNTPLEELIHF